MGIRGHNDGMDNHQTINVQQVIAGFIGAVIMVLRSPAERSVGTNVASVIAGTASATYLTPLLGKMLNQSDPNYLLGFAFLLGVLGLRGIEMIADWLGLDGKQAPKVAREGVKK
jgi:hypothetical protein